MIDGLCVNYSRKQKMRKLDLYYLHSIFKHGKS